MTLAIALLACDASSIRVGSPIDASANTDDKELQSFIQDIYARAVNEPESAFHRGRLGMTYDANGFSDAAIETYGQTHQLDSDDVRWPYLKSLALGAQGRLQEAVHSMKDAIEIDSTYVPSHLARGFWLMDLGEFEAACEAFDDADHYNAVPSNRIAIEAGRAQCSLQLGDVESAVRSLNSISGEEIPRYVELLRVRVSREQGRFALSDQDLLTDIAVDQPSWSDPIAGAVVEYTRGLSGEALLAQKLIDGGRAIDAMPLITSLLERYPGEFYVVELHSSALVALDRVDEAIDVLKRGLREFPDSYLIHFNLGSLLELKGYFEEAMTHYRQTIETKNEFIPAYDAQFELLMRKGATALARDVLEASLKYRNSDSGAYYRLGVLHGGHGDWQKSVTNFTNAIKLSPQNPVAYANMALSLGELQRTDEAKKAIERARELAPDNPKVKRAVEALIANGVLDTE